MQTILVDLIINDRHLQKLRILRLSELTINAEIIVAFVIPIMVVRVRTQQRPVNEERKTIKTNRAN